MHLVQHASGTACIGYSVRTLIYRKLRYGGHKIKCNAQRMLSIWRLRSKKVITIVVPYSVYQRYSVYRHSLLPRLGYI